VGALTLGGGYSRVVGFNPCSYAFIVARGDYSFSSTDLSEIERSRNVQQSNMRVVLEWAVGNSTCDQARTDLSSYACRAAHSECINSTNGQGYNCNCTQGYQGNPYLTDGCQDIDECGQTPNPCENGDECRNTVGGHTCHKDAKVPFLQISLGVSLALLLLLVLITWTVWILHKRKIMKQREQFFDQNGGFILKQQLSQHQGSTQAARIFTAEDLKNATNNYDEARVIGQGGFGTVYKGILSDNLEVAIKKSKITDKSQVEQFINEVVILSQINHRNVVRLLGCCLETEVPLLVYEFIKNGTLSDHIHEKIHAHSLSWEMRLRIAVEAAGALAYLHSETSTPIVHRDIKSTNILLDENYITKVSDFGASRLIPLDQSQLATLVQGTFGYMDPEYFHTSQLTEKSDVYSFGVLLAELITGEAAISFDREEKYRNLAMYFVSLVKEDRLHEILDYSLVKEVSIDHIYKVAELVKMCLRVKGEERPTMRDLSIELEGLLNSITKHEWAEKHVDNDESKYLLGEIVPSDGYNASGTSIGYDSMKDQMVMPLELVR
jgi:hypothetical protein